MKEEKRISYRAGITRKPSDFLCEDGELEECINLTTDGEELKVVTDAKNLFGGTALAGRLLFVHNLPDSSKNYICETGSASAYSLVYYHADAGGSIGSQQDFPVTTEVIHSGGMIIEIGHNTTEHNTSLKKQQITAIGKTLIVSMDNGLRYYIWKGSAYKYIGDRIPVQEVEFALSKQSADGMNASIFTSDGNVVWKTYVQNTGDCKDIVSTSISAATIHDQDKYNNLIIGLYDKNRKAINEMKGFCLPFFIRTALQLCDGSYTYVTNPILMFPSITRNTYITWMDRDSSQNNKDKVKLRTALSFLYYRSKYDYSDWSDIVKGVTVFISAPIEINNRWSDLPNPELIDYTVGGIEFDRIVSTNYTSLYEKELANNITYDFYAFKMRDKLEVTNEITSTSVFYKLADIGVKGTGTTGGHNGWEPMAGQFETRTLENITVQEQLKYDDFFSFCPLQADYLYAYNGRLNLAKVSRGFFDGFGSFMPYDFTTEHDNIITVKIETDTDTRYVQHKVKTKEIIGWWFFYPDPRATAVYVTHGQLNPFYHSLKEHPGLHGAYCFCGLPDDSGLNPTSEDGSLSFQASEPEPLNSYLIQSEVNNPWVFRSEGYHMVGDGNILAMSTQTVALSQGQFGTYPLIVFTDEGLWGLSVKATGIYGNADPFSREVCINANSVVQTDGAVYFVSKKGLMRIVGSQVVCVTEQMQGKVRNTIDLSIPDTSPDYEDKNLHEFNDMLHQCEESVGFCKFLESSSLIMAYDYVDGRILITCASEAVSPLGWAYVYSLKDGSVSRVEDAKAIKCAVTDYPDTLLQAQDGKVYSLYNKKREEEVSGRKIGLLLTRPMKLGGPLTVSSLREVMNVGEWDEPGSWVRMRVWLSDDLKTWYESTSRYGAAAMYLRIALYMKLKATERVSGSIVRYESRRDDSLRKY